MILLDANVLIYYLDETSEFYSITVNLLQELINNQEQLVTSSHIIEEVLFIFSRLMPDVNLSKVVDKIAQLPNITMIEPSPSIDFSKHYAELSKKLKIGINDALILQLMLDANITKLFSFDKKLSNKSRNLGIEQIINNS